MEYQNKFTISKYKQVFVDNDLDLELYLKIITNCLLESDSVYIFRTHNHLYGKNNLVEWCMEHHSNQLNKINVYFKQFERMLEFKSSDGSVILEVNLRCEKQREEFIKRFRISYRDFKCHFSNRVLNIQMMVDDPNYDQYDFIFVKNNNVYCWTSIHELLLFINEELYEE